MRRRDPRRYVKCENCSYVGDMKMVQTHNDMGCLRKSMNVSMMSECFEMRPSPKSPTPDRKF